MNSQFDRLKENYQTSIEAKPVGSHKPRIIFIGGAARSGTTLLQNILCSSKVTNPLIPECAIFRLITDCYIKVNSNAEKFPGIYFPKSGPHEFFRNILLEVIEETLNRFQCEKLVLKEPAMTPFFPVIHSLLGKEVRFVCLTRDPRDIAASMLQWGQRAEKRGTKHWSQQRDMKMFSDFYTSFYTFLSLEDCSLFNEILLLKYENLVTDIKKHLTILEEFTDIELSNYDPKIEWEKGFIDLSEDGPLGNAFSELYGKPVSKSNIGQFRQRLSNKEITIIDDNCALAYDLFRYKRFSNDVKGKNSKHIEQFQSTRHKKNYDSDENETDKEKKKLIALHYKAKQFDPILSEIALLKSKNKRLETIHKELPTLRTKSRQLDLIMKDLPMLRTKSRQLDLIMKDLPMLRSKARMYDDIQKELVRSKQNSIRHLLLQKNLIMALQVLFSKRKLNIINYFKRKLLFIKRLLLFNFFSRRIKWYFKRITGLRKSKK